MEILKIIDKLKSKRKVFYSESDFQFALAWEIQKYYEKADVKVRLEYPNSQGNDFSNPQKMEYVDIIVILDNKIYPIELKYKTKSLTVVDNDETYCLKNQGAQNFGRYEYLKDIQRIEKFLEKKDFQCGYAILLTNAELYWSKNNPDNMDAQFQIEDGDTKTGTLIWNGETKDKMKKGRSITLQREYKIKWNEYSNFGINNGEFRYCINVIKKS